jgi:hypothetical protein
MNQMIPLRGDSFSQFREPKYPYPPDSTRAERIRSDDTLAREGEQESAFDAKKLGSFICGYKWFLVQGHFSPSAVRRLQVCPRFLCATISRDNQRDAYRKMHTKRPRYEVESKWVLQGSPHLSGIRYAMYISIRSHK